MSVLMPSLPFHPAETPLSWAARLAAFHTDGRLVPFLNDLGIIPLALARGDAAATSRLCEIAGQEPAPVERNTVRRVDPRNFALQHLRMTTEELCRPKTQFCPACLASDEDGPLPLRAARMERLVWILRAVRTCPLHQIPLINRRIGTWDGTLRELPVFVPETRCELDELAGAQPHQEVSPLQTYVLDRLVGKSKNAWLDGMPLGLATSVTEKLGAILKFGAVVPQNKLNEAQWNAAAAVGWQFTSKGPDGVREALSIMQRRATEKSSFGITKPEIFGMTYVWLSSKKNTKELEPVRSVFRDHYLATMKAIPGELLFGEPVVNAKFSTPATIARIANVDVRTFRNLLIGKGIISRSGEGDGEGGIGDTISYDLGISVANEMKEAVSAPVGMKMLNVNRPFWNVLIKQDLLSPIAVRGGHATARCKAVNVGEISEMLTRLEELSEAVDVAAKGYRAISKCAEISKRPLADIVPALLAGKLTCVQRVTTNVGFKAIRIDPKDVIRLFAG
jgi:hypothetical protein